MELSCPAKIERAGPAASAGVGVRHARSPGGAISGILAEKKSLRIRILTTQVLRLDLGSLDHGQLGMALAFPPPFFSVQSYGLYTI